MSLLDDESPPTADWIVTYGDMMSLLLTFFILLASMSEIRHRNQYAAIADALRRRFGYDVSANSPAPGRNKIANSDLDKLLSVGRARRADTLNGGDQVRAPAGDYPRVRTIRPGDHTVVGTRIAFGEESAELSDGARRDLQVVAQEVSGKPQKMEIRGHTSARPPSDGARYRNNWDLAYARSLAVMEYLCSLGIDARRMRISVAADNEPLAVSQDPAEIKKNARVEVFLLNEIPSPDASGVSARPAGSTP